MLMSWDGQHQKLTHQAWIAPAATFRHGPSETKRTIRPAFELVARSTTSAILYTDALPHRGHGMSAVRWEVAGGEACVELFGGAK